MWSLLLATGCGEESIRGGWQDWQALYGEEWPLTRPHGMFGCTYFRGEFKGEVRELTFWPEEGSEYHLIPTFKEGNDFYPIDLIVKPDPKNPGKKMSTSVVLEQGLNFCTRMKG